LKLARESELLWKDNDDLDKMESSFHSACDKAIQKLDDLKEKLETKKDGPNWLIVSGISFATVMMIFNQLRPWWMKRKIEKLQEQQTKKQAEEMERQRLLTDEDNIITLKE